MKKLIYPIDFSLAFDGGSFRTEVKNEKELKDIIVEELGNISFTTIDMIAREVVLLSNLTSNLNPYLKKDIKIKEIDNLFLEVFYVSSLVKYRLSLEERNSDLSNKKEFVESRISLLRKLGH